MSTISDKISLTLRKQSRTKENTNDEVDDVFYDIAESQTPQVSPSEKAKVKDISRTCQTKTTSENPSQKPVKSQATK